MDVFVIVLQDDGSGTYQFKANIKSSSTDIHWLDVIARYRSSPRIIQSATYRHLMMPSWAILLITSHGPRDVQTKGCEVTVLNYVRSRHTRERVPNTWNPVYVTMIDWVCAINRVATSGDKTTYALLWSLCLLSTPYLITPWFQYYRLNWSSSSPGITQRKSHFLPNCIFRQKMSSTSMCLESTNYYIIFIINPHHVGID